MTVKVAESIVFPSGSAEVSNGKNHGEGRTYFQAPLGTDLYEAICIVEIFDVALLKLDHVD